MFTQNGKDSIHVLRPSVYSGDFDKSQAHKTRTERGCLHAVVLSGRTSRGHKGGRACQNSRLSNCRLNALNDCQD